MTPEMFFDYLAVHINGEKAGTAKAVFNIDLGNDGGKYKLELENGVLNHTADAEAKDARGGQLRDLPRPEFHLLSPRRRHKIINRYHAASRYRYVRLSPCSGADQQQP